MNASWMTRIMAAVVCLCLGCNSMTGPGGDMHTSTGGDGMNTSSPDMVPAVTEDQACTLDAQAICNLLSRCSA